MKIFPPRRSFSLFFFFLCSRYRRRIPCRVGDETINDAMHSRETWKLVPSCRLLRIARQRGAGLTTSLVSAHCGPGVHEGYVSHQHDDAVMVLLSLVLWSTPVISTTALTPIYVVHTSYNLLVGGATPEMKPKLRRQPRTNTMGDDPIQRVFATLSDTPGKSTRVVWLCTEQENFLLALCACGSSRVPWTDIPHSVHP